MDKPKYPRCGLNPNLKIFSPGNIEKTMSVKRDADIEKSLEYPTYGYVIIDTRNLSVLAGSLTRDYFFGIKFLSDIVDKTGNTFVRLVPLIKEEYEFMTRDNNE